MSDSQTMRTVLINPPSATGYAGARNRRHLEYGIRSVWYPTWLAQAAAAIPSAKLIDAAADGLSTGELILLAKGFELCVIHTAQPTRAEDLRVAERIKKASPETIVGLVGSYVALHPEQALESSPAVDFVAREEFDRSLAEIAEGRAWEKIAGISFRRGGRSLHNKDREPVSAGSPSVLPVYHRDLSIHSYAVNYLRHPYLSLYTGRREPREVIAEVRRARELFPDVREFFFDDDGFMVDLDRAGVIAKGLGRLGVSWSAKAAAVIPEKELAAFRANGLRLLTVTYDTGSEQMLGKELGAAREFTRLCSSLGIRVHGSFLLGLPGESWQSINATIRYACRLDIDSMHVSLAVPPLRTTKVLRSELDGEDLLRSLFRMYSRFYLRPRPLWRMARALWRDPVQRKRRMKAGRDFMSFLWSGPDPFVSLGPKTVPASAGENAPA